MEGITGVHSNGIFKIVDRVFYFVKRFNSIEGLVDICDTYLQKKAFEDDQVERLIIHNQNAMLVLLNILRRCLRRAASH